MAEAVYVLCAVTSVACALLLLLSALVIYVFIRILQ